MFKRLWRFCARYYFRSYLHAFKDVREREGEKEIFKEVERIQSIPLSNNINLQQTLAQKLIFETLDKGLSSILMLARSGFKKPVIMPYPQEWRRHLKTLGLKEHPASRLLFIMTILRKIRIAIVTIAALYKYTKSSAQVLEKTRDFIAFMPVPLEALKPSTSDNKLENFLSFAKEKFPNNTLFFVHPAIHRIDDHAWMTFYPFLPVQSSFKSICFLFISLLTMAQDLLMGVFGKWAGIYMLEDKIISQYISYLDRESLPEKIIFLNSHHIYKPLWTQELERKGIEIALLFYSTNTYDIQFKAGSYGVAPGYAKMTWRKFYTFHPNHQQFLEEVAKKKIEVEVDKTPINLIDCAKPLELPAGPKLALFDVQPFRESFLALIGRPTNLYYYEISELIFNDLLKWCVKNKVFLVIKPKRRVGRNLCPNYEKMLRKMADNKWCIVVDPTYSPATVCAHVEGVVCQPFTSAALSAVHLGKPVAYYDPSAILVPEQPATQGVLLVQSKEALYKFLDKCIEKK